MPDSYQDPSSGYVRQHALNRLTREGHPNPDQEAERVELDWMWDAMKSALEGKHNRTREIDPSMMGSAALAARRAALVHAPQGVDPNVRVAQDPEALDSLVQFGLGMGRGEYDPNKMGPLVDVLVRHSGITPRLEDRIRRGMHGEDPGGLADVLTKMALEKIGAPP